MGVVSECCCKEVYIIIIDILIIIITFPYSTCINSFFGSIIPISLFIFKCFFVLFNNKLHRFLIRLDFMVCLWICVGSGAVGHAFSWEKCSNQWNVPHFHR